MERWLRVVDENWVWKPHLVSERVVKLLKQDFLVREKRAPKLRKSVQETVMVDLPGMIWTGRTYRHVDVDGLKFQVPSQDWASILFELKLLPRRAFANGVAYYKLHQRFFAIVLTAEQHAALVQGMEAQLEAAEVEAEHDNKRFCEAIAEINKDGTKVVSMRAAMIQEAQKGPEGKN